MGQQGKLFDYGWIVKTMRQLTRCSLVGVKCQLELNLRLQIPPFVADPTIVLPITEDGTYYVLAYGNTSASSTPYTIIAEEIPFSILGLGVETVGNTGK